MINEYMQLALRLAERGRGFTKTNPCVGAVIVKNGYVIAEGWHKEYGGAHAEIVALNSAGAEAKGADLYVTLEPCSTYGKTPPCVDAIIDSGIKRVFIGCLDPNPKHTGVAPRQLAAAGIDVVVGVEEEFAKALIADFEKFSATGFPFVTMKIAQSLDGKIATRMGESKWITSAASRRRVHEIRSRMDAVLVGINTAVMDDPELTARLPETTRQPLRVVLDRRCRLPLNSKLANIRAAQTVVFSHIDYDKAHAAKLEALGVRVVPVGDRDSGLYDVMAELGRIGTMNLLVEGGSTVFASFLEYGYADMLHMVVAPVIIGGEKAKGAVGGLGAGTLANAVRLKDVKVTHADDIWIAGRVASG